MIPVSKQLQNALQPSLKESVLLYQAEKQGTRQAMLTAFCPSLISLLFFFLLLTIFKTLLKTRSKTSKPAAPGAEAEVATARNAWCALKTTWKRHFRCKTLSLPDKRLKDHFPREQSAVDKMQILSCVLHPWFAQFLLIQFWVKCNNPIFMLSLRTHWGISLTVTEKLLGANRTPEIHVYWPFVILVRHCGNQILLDRTLTEMEITLENVSHFN